MAVFRVRPLGVLVQVIRGPTWADLDASGQLDAGESTLLGVALGTDALAAGFSTGMLGATLAVVPAVAVACPLFLAVETALGRTVPTERLARKGFALPGRIIICALAITGWRG